LSGSSGAKDRGEFLYTLRYTPRPEIGAKTCLYTQQYAKLCLFKALNLN